MLYRIRRKLRDLYDAATIRIPPLPDHGPCRQRHIGVHEKGYYVVQVGTVFAVSTCSIVEESDIVTRISPVVVSDEYVKWDHARRVASVWNQLCSEAKSDA